MSEYTETEILQMINAKGTLQGLASDYFWERFKADPKWAGDDFDDYDEGYVPEAPDWMYEPDIDSLTVGEDQVRVRCSAPACGRGCCGYSRYTYVFPTSYLWLDQSAILADLKAKTEATKKAVAKREAQEAAEREERREKAERKRLVELKTKYEEAG